MERAEIVVVGAGVAGASAALWLSERARVRVLEQGPAAGAEASAQNAGMLRRLVPDALERALACRSAAQLERWREEGMPADAFRPTGALLAVTGPGPRAEALEGAAADLRARGLQVSSPEGAALLEVAPVLAGARVHRAWWLPEEGLLDAHAVVQTGLAAARRRGAEVELGRSVRRLIVRGGRVEGVETPTGPVLAEAVVLAAGAWGAWLAAEVGLARALVPLRRHLLHSAPHPLARPDHPYTWLDDEGLYLRPEAGGWLVSPCDELAVAPPAGGGSTGPVLEEARALALDKLERLVPAAAGLRLAGGWSGLRTFARDRRPWIGADPELEGLWWLSGLGGAGLSCAFALGEVLCASMEGRALPGLPLDALRPGRASEVDRLPPDAVQILPHPAWT